MTASPLLRRCVYHVSDAARTLAVPYGFTLSVAGATLSTAARFGVPSQLEVWCFAVAGVATHTVLSLFARWPPRSGPVAWPATGPSRIQVNLAPVVTIPLCAGVANASHSGMIAYPAVGAVCIVSYVALLCLAGALANRGRRREPDQATDAAPASSGLVSQSHPTGRTPWRPVRNGGRS